METIKVVGAFLEHPNKPNKILTVLEKRKFNGKNKAIWKIPTGTKFANETNKHCLIRELKEETGYTVCIKKKILNYKYVGNEGDKIIRTDFLCEVVSGVECLKEDEILDLEWTPKNKLAEKIKRPIEKYSTDILVKKYIEKK